MSGSMEPIDLEHDCPFCGGDREFRYEDERVQLACDNCDLRSDADVPPGVFIDVDREDVPLVAMRYFQATIGHLRHGFCSFCDGLVGRDLISVGDMMQGGDGADGTTELDDEWIDVPMVEYDCGRCAVNQRTDLGTGVLDEPAVVCFFHDHGIDVRDPEWVLMQGFDPEDAWFLDENHERARAQFSAGGETLLVDVNADCEVLAVERRAE